MTIRQGLRVVSRKSDARAIAGNRWDFVCSIWFIWLNQMNQADQINQTDQSASLARLSYGVLSR
jgi:hypothetical protein